MIFFWKNFQSKLQKHTRIFGEILGDCQNERGNVKYVLKWKFCVEKYIKGYPGDYSLSF